MQNDYVTENMVALLPSGDSFVKRLDSRNRRVLSDEVYRLLHLVSP